MSTGVVDRPARSRWSPWLVALGAGVVFGLQAGRPEWSVDEGATVVVVRSPWSAAWRMSWDDAALGPYYLLLKPWAAISTGHLWLRLPSVVAAAVATAVVFVLVRRVAGARPAALTAALLVVLPATSRVAASARPYAWVTLTCAVAALAWWLYVERGRPVHGALLVAALVLTGLAHTYALLLGIPFVVAALVAPLHERRRDVLRTLLAGAIALGLLGPWLVHVADQAHGSPSPARVAPRTVTSMFLLLPTTGTGRTALAVGLVVSCLALVGGITAWLAGGPPRTLAVLTAAWAVLPALVLVSWQEVTGKPGVVTRYWLFCVPAIAVLAGLGLSRLGRRHHTVALAVLLGITVACLPVHRAIRTADDPPARQVYLDLLAVMHIPRLESVPVVLRGAHLRGVLANDPGAAVRFPLLVDTQRRPLDLVHPHARRVGTPAWDRLVAAEPTILVLQGLPRPQSLTSEVTAEQFVTHRRELRVYDQPDVLCVFSGELLGVFSQDDTAFTHAERVDLARSIEAVDPRHVRCRA